jgi:hypothetical protein
MNKSALAGFAVLLAGGFLALYFLVIKDPPKPSDAAPSSGSAATTAGTPTGIGPALPNAAGSAQLPQDHRSTQADRDTTGLVLTDHRSAGSGAVVLDGTEGSGAPVRPVLDPGLVRSVHRNAQAIMLACAAKVPPADRGPRPRIGATLKVALRDHELVVVEVTPELRDLGGPEQKTAEDCVRNVMINFTAPTPDSEDGEGYELHYQYVVR